MRCVACNRVLSDRDASRKSPVTKKYYDLCSHCFDTIADDVESVENPLLEGDNDTGEEDESN